MTDQARPRLDPPPRVSWELVGIVFAMAVQAMTAVWWASGAEHRIAAVEASTQPLDAGVVSRLDERTLAISAGVDRLNHRLDIIEEGRRP
ncbi:MAG: hypothetical protein J7521_20875 [Caulobacter sp.]|nr:hypothetical protein [Caulobacter sp.]